MKHKKLKLSAVLLLGLGLTSIQAQTMYVKTKGGTQTSFTLNEIQKMTFASGNITINKITGSPDSYVLSDLHCLLFNASVTEVEETTSLESSFIIYPNPVNTELNLQPGALNNQTTTIQILSIDGRMVYHEQVQTNATNHQINISALPEGLYLCRITNGINSEIKKFIKQ